MTKEKRTNVEKKKLKIRLRCEISKKQFFINNPVVKRIVFDIIEDVIRDD